MTRSSMLCRRSRPDAGFSLIEMLAALTVASLVAVVIMVNLPRRPEAVSSKWESVINAAIFQAQRNALLSQKAQGLRMQGDVIESVQWNGSDWISNSRRSIRLDGGCVILGPASRVPRGAPQIIADAAGVVSAESVQLKCDRLRAIDISAHKALGPP